VHADTEATFSHDYEAIAQKLNIDTSRLYGENLFKSVREGIEALPNWVLILDNADDLKLFGVGQASGETKAPIQHIPHASTGTVLWTTRDAHITGTLIGQSRGIEIARMTVDEAKQLLVTFESVELNREGAEIEPLVKELQLLPLAIMQAGAYMSRTSVTPKEYLSLLAQGKKRWETLKADDFNRHRRPSVPNNILETWAISIVRIKQESELTYKILHVIAYISNENIPHELIMTALKHISKKLRKYSELLETEAIKIITRLKEFSFIGIRQVEHGSRNYEMHKLLQEALRYGLSMRISNTISKNVIVKTNISTDKRQKQTSRHKVVPAMKNFAKRNFVKLKRVSANESERYFSTIALQVTSDLFLSSERDTWSQCEKFLAHVLQVGEWADVNEKQIKTARLLYKASIFLGQRRRWRESESVDERVLHYRQKMLGDTHPATADAIESLAITYAHLGRYSEAERLQSQALDLRRMISKDKHPDIFDAMEGLAYIYYKQGRYREAERLQSQVLNSRREILEDKHPSIIEAMEGLALIYYKQGRYSEAEPLEVQVLDLTKQILGDRHLHTIEAMHNLAWSWYRMSRHGDATALMQRALEYSRSTLGPKHPQTEDSAKSLQEFESQPKH
jgi:tetratricopeptide (TPR) repeat protein